ncbi:6600_t:CDS:2, partial [Gigaspora rosea]
HDPWNQTFDDKFSQKLNFTNYYNLSPNNYSRKVAKMLDNNFINYIGHGSTYSSNYFLESNIQTTSLKPNTSHNITVEVYAQDYIIEERAEQR